MTGNSNPTSFALYRWSNPETTSDYPFLAVAEDWSVLLSLGNYSASFDWGIPEDARHWLAQDFTLTGESLVWDVSMVRHVLATTFVGGTEFGLVTFDPQLGPNGLQLALSTQAQVEYLVQGFGSYQRFYRDPEEIEPVMPSERAMLDLCISMFAELAGQCIAKLTEPPPPRYRSPASAALVN